MAKEIPSGWCTSTFLFYRFLPTLPPVLPFGYSINFSREETNIIATKLTGGFVSIYPSDTVIQIQNKINTSIINPANTIINVISYDLVNGLLVTLSMPSSSIVNPSIKAYGIFRPNEG